MDIIWFYVLAVIPFMIGGVMWTLGRKVIWQEWAAGSCAAFVMAGIFHAFSVGGLTKDVETWSGQIVKSTEHSAWVEYYEYAVYRTEVYTTTDAKGNMSIHTRQVFSHWEPTKRTHNIHWRAQSNISTSYDITQAHHNYLEKRFADRHPVKGVRRTGEHASRMLSGDPNDYVAYNKTGWIEPITKLVRFENKIKATPTTFSYQKVPANAKVYPYPANANAFKSDRLVGTATKIDWLAFDQLNARLGGKKKVNVILVGMGDVDSMAAQYQEAAWVGGKKNDVVICWGGDNLKPTWVRAFGWTEKKECLRQLEAIVLESGISTERLNMIEDEITRSYVIKDWKKFDYIRVPAPASAFYWYFGVTILVQFLYWWWARKNEFEK